MVKTDGSLSSVKQRKLKMHQSTDIIVWWNSKIKNKNKSQSQLFIKIN